jgi:hypothetical protein
MILFDLLDVVHTLTIVSFVVDYQYPIPPSGRPGGGGSRSPHGPGGGGSHSPNGPPCTSCPYPGACPWCHVR